MSMQTVFNQFGSWLVSGAIFLFAFTTLITYYYIAETGIAFFDRNAKYPFIKTIAKVLCLVALFYGSIEKASTVWALGDIAFGALAYVNLVALVLLSKPLLTIPKDYERQRKEGKDPIFDPRNVGMKNAEYWEYYISQHEKRLQGLRKE